MYLIIVTYCLLSQPAACVQQQAIIDNDIDTCGLDFLDSIGKYEAANPGWKMKKGTCVDLKGEDV